MAASDWFSIKIKGRQTARRVPVAGDGSDSGCDADDTGLQMIVARQSELTKAPVVITVGRINGGIREKYSSPKS